MDAPTAQEKPVVDPPRHLFFGVEDRRQGGRAGLDPKYWKMESDRRKKLAEHVRSVAGQIISGVRTLEDFDRTGNADQVLDHLNVLRDDLNKKLNNLIGEVEQSVDRYGEELKKLSFRDIAAARQASDAQTPKPGPRPVVVHADSFPDAPILKAKVEAALDAQAPKPTPGPIVVNVVSNPSADGHMVNAALYARGVLGSWR